MLVGDFNSKPPENAVIEFFKDHKLKNLVKGATCYKNYEKLSCIDLILTDRPKSFQRYHIVGTKLSEFHKITVTALKIYFKRQDLRVIHYRDYKKFNTKGFRQDFFASLHKENVDINHKKSF